jgi:hypothetical protein
VGGSPLGDLYDTLHDRGLAAEARSPGPDPPWSSQAWCWLLSLSGVASWMLPPGVASALILVL